MTNALTRPAIGEPAPNIVALDVSGEQWRLKGCRGRTVVLVFHRHIH